MKKTCIVYIGVLLLALCSQVAQSNSTASPMNVTVTTAYGNMSTSLANTTDQAQGGSDRTDAFTLLLPLAVAASLLHGWS